MLAPVLYSKMITAVLHSQECLPLFCNRKNGTHFQDSEIAWYNLEFPHRPNLVEDMYVDPDSCHLRNAYTHAKKDKIGHK